ncbi:MAG: hypothetical protein XE01_1007 [Synergistales bacterium 58_81]|nr:MAG: hypothetical protein XE01_1007 [Synergistales bacterium 58_81]
MLLFPQEGYLFSLDPGFGIALKVSDEPFDKIPLRCFPQSGGKSEIPPFAFRTGYYQAGLF